jgi:hypothetical protein
MISAFRPPTRPLGEDQDGTHEQDELAESIHASELLKER